MLISGAREWVGKDARTFLLAKTMVEQQLLALGYHYFHSGIVSKRSIYEEHVGILGKAFQNIFIDFSFQDMDYILAPEYTFRVFEYLKRRQFPEDLRMIFYSQEMARNETKNDIQQGKTFSFWQIGYEIFGSDDSELSIESVTTLWVCLQCLPLDSLHFRISDKRILEALCKRYSVSNRSELLSLIEACEEDESVFYLRYIQRGGNREFAQVLQYLLGLANDRTLPFNELRNILSDDKGAQKAIEELENIYSKLELLCGHTAISVVPAMPKTWDALYSMHVWMAMTKL